MNHLHGWLEQYEGGGIPDALITQAKNSICFSMPDMSSCPRVEHQPELLRLPYQYTWIEGRGKVAEQDQGDSGIVGMLGKQTPDGFLILVYTRVNIPGRGQVWLECLAFGWSPVNGWLRQPISEVRQMPGMIQNPDETIPDLVDAYRDWLGSFLTLLNCANVSRSEHHPGEQLQKARVRRGKLPLYSYWTLDLNLSPAGRGESGGGTHASPRLHLRRGHTRQYQPGKWCWINPCAVGNKKLGVVHKDYAVHHKAAS